MNAAANDRIGSVLLHGSALSEADAPGFRKIREIIVAAGAACRFTATFHPSLSALGLDAPGDEVVGAGDIGTSASDLVLTFGGDGTVLELSLIHI